MVPGHTIERDEQRRQDWRGLLVLAVAAFALRAAWVAYRWQESGPWLEFDDERLHWQLATKLVQRGALVSDDGRYAARMPLYPLFLALFAWVGEGGIFAARLAQALVSACCAPLAGRVAGAVFGRRGGWLAGALVAVDPFNVFFCNLLLSEAVFTCVALAFAASTWRVLSDPDGVGRRGVMVLAATGAAAVLTRPSAAGWVLLVWLLVPLFDHRRARGAVRVALCMAVMAGCLLPWGLRNRSVVGDFAWLSTNGGVTLYDAQGPQARGDSDQSFLARMPELAELDEVQRDHRLQELALRQMWADPVRVLRLAGVKFLRTWSLVPNVADYRRGVAAYACAAFTLAVLAAAVAGLASAALPGKLPADWRRSVRSLAIAVLLPVAYFTLVHCVYVGSVRYRVPLMPQLALLGGGAAIVFRANVSSDQATQRAAPR
ncbi:MAG: glycosyltransferase family 39 protein [Phycisphaerae bacterium]|jgi:hypothetical protein